MSENKNDQHVVPHDKGHVASIDCWCAPRVDDGQSIPGGGRVWIHRDLGSWSTYLESVSVQMGIPVRLGVEHHDGRERVFVELSVKCSRTGEPITVKTGRPVQPLGMLTDREAAEVVRDLVRIAICHEIDEAITVSGERVFDPHRGAP